MNDNFTHEERWVVAEQRFMRVLGIGMLVIAFISIFFGVFPFESGQVLAQTVNVTVTMVLGIGALWSLWWSSDINRMYNLIDGFKDNGSTRTYLAAAMQLIVGLLFASELIAGNITMGALGVLILISAGFFIWRAQQINQARAY